MSQRVHPQPLKDLPQQDIPRRRGDSHVEGCAVARDDSAGGCALPQHLDLMSSDAGNRAGSTGLAIVLAHPNDAVAQR